MERPTNKADLNAFERLLNRSGVDPDDIDSITRMNVYQTSMKDADGEWNTIDQYAMQVRPKSEKEQLEKLVQAAPARITPSRRKPIKRDHKTLLVFSDMQIDFRRDADTMNLMPIHDERAIAAMIQLSHDLRPDEIINCGDTIDYAALSRFAPDSDHFYRTLAPAHQLIHNIYAQLRSDNPDAKITEVDSNHHKRLVDTVLKQMPDLYNFKRPGDSSEYPVFTYPYLANLGHVGVNWVSGYGAAEYAYKDDLVFTHGTFAVSSGSTAAKLSKANPDRNIIQGHRHSMETHYRTDRSGNQLGAFVVGALCRTTGEVPSYHSAVNDHGKPVHYQEDWQNGVMVIRDYGNGNYQFDHVPITRGVIRYNGREYDGNTIQ